MGRFSLSFWAVPLRLFLITVFANNLQTSFSQLAIGDLLCAFVNCGEGTCRVSNTSSLGLDCECNAGWQNHLGLLPIFSCVIPSCTVDLQCGDGSPPPPLPPPPPPLRSLLNFSNPCALVWCGDGNCVANGTSYTCQCNEGSVNLLNLPAFPCFKKCYLGADCTGLNLGIGPPTTPPSASGFGVPPTGSMNMPNSPGNLGSAMTLVAAALLLLT